MTRNVQGVCLLVLLAVSSFAELNASPDRTLLGSSASLSQETSASTNSPSGKASARSAITVKEGEGVAIATATSEAFTESVTKIVALLRDVVGTIPKKGKRSKKEYCDEVAVTMEESIESIARVGVEATASTFSFVSIDGVGEGCANSEAEAEAKAIAFAKALIGAWAEAKGHNNIARAEARVQSVIRILAAATASSAANACIQADGSSKAPSFAEAYQDVVATAYTDAVATILVWLEASVDCSGTGDSFVEAETEAALRNDDASVTADGSSNVEGTGSADTLSSGSAIVNRTRPCRRNRDLRKCCRGRNMRSNQNNCYCNAFARPSRFSAPACEAEKIVVDGKIFWNYMLKNGKEGICSC